MSPYREAAKALAREAVLIERGGDNSLITIPIVAWRQFWTTIDGLDAANTTPYAHDSKFCVLCLSDEKGHKERVKAE